MRQKRTLQEILKDLQDNPPQVLPGHPLAKEKGLSEDDEKRVDERGDPVVTGLPWSGASTGLWLALLGTRQPLHILQAGCTNSMGTEAGGLFLTLVVTEGRPTLSRDAWGSCLELPSDLGQDPLKRAYLMEWLTHTAAETLELATAAGAFKGFPGNSHTEFAMWLHLAAENLIRRTGL